MTADGTHEPVLLGPVLAWLAPAPGATIVDGTLGPGGHAEALLERVGPTGRVVGIDRDRRALARAAKRLARFGGSFLPLHGDHRDLPALLDAAGIGAVEGVLYDLGISSVQLDDAGRGFSFRADGPLDMRMDPDGGGPTATDVLATRSEAELRTILWTWGEERLAGPIARAIVRRRATAPLATTRELAELVERVAGPAARRYRIHPATRTFQALRIVVNREVEGLATAVEGAVARLAPGGRVVVLSYHSLEDRAVKRALRGLAHRCVCPPALPVCGCGRTDLVRVLTPQPVRPGDDEVRANPRARSARLRAAERLP